MKYSNIIKKLNDNKKNQSIKKVVYFLMGTILIGGLIKLFWLYKYPSFNNELQDISISVPEIMYLGSNDIVNISAKGSGNLENTEIKFKISNTNIADFSKKEVLKGQSVNNTLIPKLTGEFVLSIDASLENVKLPQVNRVITVCKSLSNEILDSKVITIAENDYVNVEPALGDSRICYKDLKYTISDKNISTIDKNGNLKGIKEGNATLTISNSQNTIKQNVTIINPKSKVGVKSITINKKNIELYLNNTEQLTVSINPRNATNQNIVWKTNNQKIATVSKNGLVTAKGQGTTVISAVSEDNRYVEKVNVVVKEKTISSYLNISFTENGNIVAAKTHSTKVTVERNIVTMKYLWTKTSCTSAINGTTFKNGETVSLTNVSGKYYLSIYVKDTNGSEKNMCSKYFNFDNTKPAKTPEVKTYNKNNVLIDQILTSAKSVSERYYSNTEKVTIKLSGTNDSNGIIGYAYNSKIGDPLVDISNIVTLNLTSAWNIFYFYSKDAAGNYSQYYTRYAIKYSPELYNVLLDGQSYVLNREPNSTYTEYTTQEKEFLTHYLKHQIRMAGYETRAGVVVAAKFLALQFKTQIKYISGSTYNEFGLNINDANTCWNCVDNNQQAYGLQCSGFVHWALLNAGFDMRSDVEQQKEKLIKEYKILGTQAITKYNIPVAIFLGNYITGSQPIKYNSNINWSTIKAGDLTFYYGSGDEELIGTPDIKTYNPDGTVKHQIGGHIGIIIGLDSNYVYIAHSADWQPVNGVQVTRYPKNNIGKWTTIVKMDGVYKSNGNYTNDWKISK